ncbi:MAG: hypothetical protein ACTSU9_04640 [Promethearchaeota archaeon]
MMKWARHPDWNHRGAHPHQDAISLLDALDVQSLQETTKKT